MIRNKHHEKFEDIALLVARILMPILFISAGYGKIGGYEGTAIYASNGRSVLLPLTILLELGGGLAILFGFNSHHSNLYRGLYFLTALLFHSNFAEGMNQLMFMKT